MLASNGARSSAAHARGAVAPSAPRADRIRRLGRFYFEHWTRNREYFQIFWALENQAVIGELPERRARRR